MDLTREQRAVREAFAALFEKQATPQRVRRAEWSPAMGFDGLLWALFGPESYVRASAAAIDIAGAAGMLDWTDPQSAVDGGLDAHYRSAVATTIYGGSSEVLRSLIAENRLGLPRSRPRR